MTPLAFAHCNMQKMNQKTINRVDNTSQDINISHTGEHLMLLDVYKNGDIVTVKLVTAEEIIARYEGEQGGNLELSKPAVVVPHGQGMQIVPWIMSSLPDKFAVRDSAVVFVNRTDENIAKIYLEKTSSIQVS